jgi:PQQ enzyme repeat
VQPQATDHFGEVQAWSVNTGQRVWMHTFEKSPNWGAMLATAGGPVISGGTNDREVRAFDAKDGKMLWEFQTSSGVEAPVTTYLVDAKQYLAVLPGWGGRCERYAWHDPADSERSSFRARRRVGLGICAGVANAKAADRAGLAMSVTPEDIPSRHF